MQLQANYLFVPYYYQADFAVLHHVHTIELEPNLTWFFLSFGLILLIPSGNYFSSGRVELNIAAVSTDEPDKPDVNTELKFHLKTIHFCFSLLFHF